MVKRITKSIIVGRTLPEVFRLWSDFQNFPNFMKYVEKVERSGGTSRWQVTGAAGRKVTWEAEMTLLEPDKRIAWSSKDMEGTVTTSGQVTFTRLGEKETEVTLLMQFELPAGKVGEILADIFANPEERIEKDLRNFKQFAEGMYDRVDA